MALRPHPTNPVQNERASEGVVSAVVEPLEGTDMEDLVRILEQEGVTSIVRTGPGFLSVTGPFSAFVAVEPKAAVTIKARRRTRDIDPN